jgi:hypothetical protein
MSHFSTLLFQKKEKNCRDIEEAEEDVYNIHIKQLYRASKKK